MSQYFDSSSLLLPTIDLFIARIADDLVNRRSVVVVLPNRLDPYGIWNSLQERLWKREYQTKEIYLSDSFGSDGPVDGLSQSLEIAWPENRTPRTVENLYQTCTSLPDVVFLGEMENLAHDSRSDWLTFVQRWADVSHSRMGERQEKCAFCVILPAKSIEGHIPKKMLLLAIHWWWGFPSRLEMHLHCRTRSQIYGHSPMAHWRENILPELVGSDMEAVEHLWDAVVGTNDEILDSLSRYATEIGWSAERLLSWGAEKEPVASARSPRTALGEPAEKWFRLWANGVVYCTEENGIEYHAAALATLGLSDQLDHRLWRGQAALLLPLLDQLRLEICTRFTNRFDFDWPFRWGRPESDMEEEALRQSPNSCQWGYLKYLLRHSEELQSVFPYQSLARTAHHIRNEIAHYRPVSFAHYERLRIEIELARIL